MVIVDNDSEDETLDVVSALGVANIRKIRDYTPGRAINIGIEACSGEFVVLLSGHCVPATPDWLEKLYMPIAENPEFAASYGRQLPLPFSQPADKADLYAVFRPESRIQSVDGFLNNANSIIRKKVWEDIKFDEDVRNIEDRVWGEKVISQGHKIFYNALASVFHHNGMHRSSERSNQTPTVEVIEKLVLPPSELEESSYRSLFTGTFVPVLISNTESEEELQGEVNVLTDLTLGEVWQPPLVVSEVQSKSLNPISRRELGLDPHDSVENLLRSVAFHLKKASSNNQFMGLFIARMGLPTRAAVEALVEAIVRGGKDFSFQAQRDFAHVWHEDSEGNLIQLDPSFGKRHERQMTYQALYGSGSIFPINNCLSGDFFRGNAALVDTTPESMG